MKKFLLFLLATLTFVSSCTTKKGFQANGDAERSLNDAIRYLNRNPNDTAAIRALPGLYQQVSIRYLDQIHAYRLSQQPERWDKIISHYNRLQQVYDQIMQSTAAYKLVTPVSYSTEIFSSKDSAAGIYYQIGEDFMVEPGRNGAQQAYRAFKKSNNYIPGYKNVQQRMQDAIEKGTVNVVLFPVKDQSSPASGITSIFPTRNGFVPLHERLVNELENERRAAARFYSEKDLQSRGLNQDWEVSFILKTLQLSQPVEKISKRTVTKNTPIGTDSTGQTQYKTLYATIQTKRTDQKANASVQLIVFDKQTNREIASRTFNDEYAWTLSSSTYQGDRRALGPEDWEQINNSQVTPPKRNEILEELYKKFQPQLFQEIRQTCVWNY
jgi:hypothetical protein